MTEVSFAVLSKLYNATELLMERLLVYVSSKLRSVSVIIPELCAAVKRYGVFKFTFICVGSLEAELNDHCNLLFAETHKPQPRVFTLFDASPINALRVPDPPVVVKLMSSCQLVRDAICGNSYVVGVVDKLAPLNEYIVFVVAAPLLTVATVLGLTKYEKSPKLFELGSIKEKDGSEKL